MPKPVASDAGSVGDLSVVDRVFTSFVNAVADTDGYAEIADRLKCTILDDRDLSESAIDRALFGVQPT